MERTWIRQPSRIENVENYLHFAWADHPTAGFSFPCDEGGNPDMARMAPEALVNLRACQSGWMDGRRLLPQGVKQFGNSYWDAGAIRCTCGSAVELEDARHGPLYAARCACHRWWNLSGQELNPPEQWEESLEED